MGKYRFFNKGDKYVVTEDVYGLTVTFSPHDFNGDKDIDTGSLPIDASLIARELRQLGDWVAIHHADEALPNLKYELRLSDDDRVLSVIRHKDPKFKAFFDITDTEVDLKAFGTALKKAGEYLIKRHYNTTIDNENGEGE